MGSTDNSRLMAASADRSGDRDLLLYRMAVNRRSTDRFFSQPDAVADDAAGDSPLMGMLRHWLFLAGYRQPEAPVRVRRRDARGGRAGAGHGNRRARLGRDATIVRQTMALPAARAICSSRWPTWRLGRCC